MTTQELKQQIDKVLGNSIRCLLPSYWWKRLFNQVADRIDEVEQTTSQLIDSKVEEVKMPIVESVDELEKLKLAKGRVAAVEKTGEFATVKISDCYFSLNREEDWSKYTIVKGIEEKDNVIIDKETSVLFSASKEMITKDALQVNTLSSGIFYYMKWTDDAAYFSSLEEVNKALSSGKYRAVQYINAPDDYFTFYSEKPQPSLYIKGDSWEKLSKEYVVSSEKELNALSVENGTIAKVAKWQYGEVDPYQCYSITNESSHDDDTIKRIWDKLTRISHIDITYPETPPTVMPAWPTILLHGYASTSDDVIQITYYQESYKIEVSNSDSTNIVSIDKMNTILQEKDYRLIDLTNDKYARPFIEEHITFYSPNANITADAYIKGETWTRLLKEGDVTGGADITIDSELSDTSENPVQNKVLTSAIESIALELGEMVGDINTSKADKTYVDEKLANIVASSFVVDLTVDEIEEAISNNGGVIDYTLNRELIIDALSKNIPMVVRIGEHSNGYCLAQGELDGADTLTITFNHSQYKYSILIGDERIEVDKRNVESFVTSTQLDSAIAQAITNTLNTEV
jgi:hypothetical protein